MGGLGLPSASLLALSIVQPLPTLPAIFGLARLPMLDLEPSKGSPSSYLRAPSPPPLLAGKGPLMPQIGQGLPDQRIGSNCQLATPATSSNQLMQPNIFTFDQNPVDNNKIASPSLKALAKRKDSLLAKC